MKKIIKFLLLSIFLADLFLPVAVLADGTYTTANGKTVEYEGFVPCGKEVIVNGNPVLVYCQFCHFFVMLNGIIRFFLFMIVPPLAVLMLVVGGIMFFFAGGRPQLLSKGKSLIQAVVIGLVLIYGAYLIVSTFLTVLGVADWVPLSEWSSKGAFGIKCGITLP